MINFSTEFPIDGKNTIEDVVRLARDWVIGSPHTKIPSNALDHFPIDDEEAYSSEFGQVTIGIATLPEARVGGLQYIHRDAGLEWTTSIVSFAANRLLQRSI